MTTNPKVNYCIGIEDNGRQDVEDLTARRMADTRVEFGRGGEPWFEVTDNEFQLLRMGGRVDLGANMALMALR